MDTQTEHHHEEEEEEEEEKNKTRSPSHLQALENLTRSLKRLCASALPHPVKVETTKCLTYYLDL
jgi:CRISPR/Cas system-associated protein Cas7 (RAMP superfamily)